MVKVPYKDGLYGPYFRVEEPYTPEEAAYFNSGPAFDVPHPYGEEYILAETNILQARRRARSRCNGCSSSWMAR